MRLFQLIVICMILFSCQGRKSTKKPQFRFIKNMVFDSGFKSGNGQIESFKGKEFLCIGEYNKMKKIAVHSLDGGKPLTIDISKLKLFNERLLAYEILNLDTILVLPHYSNILYCMNQKGDIWKIIDLNPYLKKEGRFELKRSATPFHFKDNTLIFSLEYHRNEEKEYDIYTYRKSRNAAPSLLKIEDVFKDSLKVTIGLRNLYNNFSDAKHVNIEGNNFKFINDEIIFSSAYSDSLYIIDPNQLKIKQKIKVTSKYSQIYIHPITNEEQQQNPDLVNLNFRSNGQIKGVKYHQEKQLYLVFVSHKPDPSKKYWSIIVLDKDFNKINEYLMDGYKYAPYGMMSTKGLLISNYYETLRDITFYDKNTYTLYNFE